MSGNGVNRDLASQERPKPRKTNHTVPLDLSVDFQGYRKPERPFQLRVCAGYLEMMQ
jgi:hypothetical protein